MTPDLELISALQAQVRQLELEIKVLKKHWVQCHQQCGVEFHKAYCPFPKLQEIEEQKCGLCGSEVPHDGGCIKDE